MECYQRIDSSNATLTEMIQTTNDKNKEQDAALQQTKIDLVAIPNQSMATSLIGLPFHCRQCHVRENRAE